MRLGWGCCSSTTGGVVAALADLASNFLPTEASCGRRARSIYANSRPRRSRGRESLRGLAELVSWSCWRHSE